MCLAWAVGIIWEDNPHGVEIYSSQKIQTWPDPRWHMPSWDRQAPLPSALTRGQPHPSPVPQDWGLPREQAPGLLSAGAGQGAAELGCSWKSAVQGTAQLKPWQCHRRWGSLPGLGPPSHQPPVGRITPKLWVSSLAGALPGSPPGMEAPGGFWAAATPAGNADAAPTVAEG